MGKVKRRVENEEGTVTELVVGELGFLQLRFLVNDHEGTRMRRCAKGIINQAGLQHLVGWQ